jgi:spoIIIJ-associated protein
MTTTPQDPEEQPAEGESGGVVVEASRFEEAIAEAAARLGISASELRIHVIDPGRSETAEGGFRPVRIRAWKRGSREAPDGARPGAAADRGAGDDESPRSRRSMERREPRFYGPPPPPMDPDRITPELVEQTRALCEGLVRSMGFEARAVGSKTKHGIRIDVDADEQNQYLIGRDGEALGSIQYLVARMLRANLREDSMPRIEVDVAGFRESRNEELREIAHVLMEEARRTGGEAVSEPLPAAERRVVHLEVAEAPGLTTVTIGEGEYKRVVVRTGEPEDAP